MWKLSSLLLVLLLLGGCSTPLMREIIGDRGCHIDGMITDFNDNDGCVSPEARYCTLPGYIFDPNADGDKCVTP